MISLLIYLVIFVILISFAYWVIQQTLPPPIQKYAIIVLALVGVILVIWLLLQLAGGGPLHLPVVK